MKGLVSRINRVSRSGVKGVGLSVPGTGTDYGS